MDENEFEARAQAAAELYAEEHSGDPCDPDHDLFFQIVSAIFCDGAKWYRDQTSGVET